MFLLEQRAPWVVLFGDKKNPEAWLYLRVWAYRVFDLEHRHRTLIWVQSSFFWVLFETWTSNRIFERSPRQELERGYSGFCNHCEPVNNICPEHNNWGLLCLNTGIWDHLFFLKFDCSVRNLINDHWSVWLDLIALLSLFALVDLGDLSELEIRIFENWPWSQCLSDELIKLIFENDITKAIQMNALSNATNLKGILAKLKLEKSSRTPE